VVVNRVVRVVVDSVVDVVEVVVVVDSVMYVFDDVVVVVFSLFKD